MLAGCLTVKYTRSVALILSRRNLWIEVKIRWVYRIKCYSVTVLLQCYSPAAVLQSCYSVTVLLQCYSPVTVLQSCCSVTVLLQCYSPVTVLQSCYSPVTVLQSCFQIISSRPWFIIPEKCHRNEGPYYYSLYNICALTIYCPCIYK